MTTPQAQRAALGFIDWKDGDGVFIRVPSGVADAGTAPQIIKWAGVTQSWDPASKIMTLTPTAEGLGFVPTSREIQTPEGSGLTANGGTSAPLAGDVALQVIVGRNLSIEDNVIGFDYDVAEGADPETVPLRGTSGELAAAYIYGAGTVAASGFIRLARNFTAIACKTSGGTDHPILVEDNADGFVWGSSTLSAGWTTHVKTGGAWVLKVNNVTKITGDASGINVPSGSTYNINGTPIGAAGRVAGFTQPSVGGTASAIGYSGAELVAGMPALLSVPSGGALAGYYRVTAYTGSTISLLLVDYVDIAPTAGVPAGELFVVAGNAAQIRCSGGADWDGDPTDTNNAISRLAAALASTLGFPIP